MAAEAEAHVYGLPPDLVMTATDRLREAVEQAEARGVAWGPVDGAAELVRRYGRDGAQQKADHARIAYQVILESEAPRVVESVKALGKDWGNDPRVIETFAVIYDAVSSAPMSPKLEALFLRRDTRQRAAEDAARAEGAKIRQQEDAAAAEASAEFMTATAATHRRWGKSDS